MFYQTIHPRLQPLVVCYWIIQATNIPLHTKMLPDGYSDIMLNLGEAYSVETADGKTETISDSRLFGQRTCFLLLNQPKDANMIGIRLQPGTEYLFSGIQASKLVNASVSLSQITGAAYKESNKFLDHASTDQEKIYHTENLLLSIINRHDIDPDEKTAKLIHTVLKNKGNLNLENYLEDEGLSYKQAERGFKKHLGLTPKQFARIHRFYYAFTQVRSLQKADWMKTLHNCGYYDQAHFIKDFRIFSGLSPTRQFTKKDTLDDFFGFK